MNDDSATISRLKGLVSDFTKERDWSQYHDPKSLVMALASEVGELADHFRWLTREESFAVFANQSDVEAISGELADVLMFALEFASVCNLDVSQAIESKLRINAAKYPVERAKGRKTKYDRL